MFLRSTTKLAALRCPQQRHLRSVMSEVVGTLYKKDESPPARTVLMVADLLGLKFQGREINPILREQYTPEIIKKNPMRTIPILEQGDFNLADSHAIILYLMDKYGKPEHSYLYPTDKRKRAIVNQILFFECGILFPRLKAVMARTYFSDLTELTKSMIKNIDAAYEMLDMYLQNANYLADDVITLADISVLTTTSTLNGLHPIDETRYPKLKKWFLNMSEQEVCKRINEPGAEEHILGLKAYMNHNREKKSSKL